MKNKLFGITALVLALGVFLTACNAIKHTITISNNGTVDYCELLVSPTGADAFGDNQLPDGETVTPGNEFNFDVEEAGDYDVKVVGCDDAGEQVLTVSVP